MGEGTKRPTFGETLDLYGQIGNPNLKSERQKSWEAGFDQFLANKKLKFSATYYENEIDDLIAWAPTPTTPPGSPPPFANGTNYENIREGADQGRGTFLVAPRFS